MEISPNLAQKIVDNLRVTLNHEINFMNKNKIIVASSDKKRINTFHGGTAIVFQTKMPLFIEYDGQYEGAKMGMNLPIYFEKEIIGAIGVTGGKEVLMYAEIVKAMTEILIKEAYLNAVTFQNREKHRLIIETLLLTPENLVEEKLFDLDFSNPYFVMVGKSEEAQDLSFLFPLLESILSAYPQIFFTINYSFILLLSPKMELNFLLALIQEKVFEVHQLSLHFGVGLTTHSKDAIKNSFETAKQALYWTYHKNQKTTIAHFDTLDIGMIVSTIPKKTKRLFLANVFKNLTEKEIRQIVDILQSFEKHNGKLSIIAKELFIHKNTLQYQLNKIKKLTGFDPRNYHDFSILQIALLVYEEKEIYE